MRFPALLKQNLHQFDDMYSNAHRTDLIGDQGILHILAADIWNTFILAKSEEIKNALQHLDIYEQC